MSAPTEAPLAVSTGASSGIGLELAKLAAADGYALLLAADRSFNDALAQLGGATFETVSAYLSMRKGVAVLDERIGTRLVYVLCADAGHGADTTDTPAGSGEKATADAPAWVGWKRCRPVPRRSRPAGSTRSSARSCT